MTTPDLHARASAGDPTVIPELMRLLDLAALELLKLQRYDKARRIRQNDIIERWEWQRLRSGRDYIQCDRLKSALPRAS